jgi:hypothetical protein
MRLRIWILVGAALLVFAAANVHLLYVAMTSQPACVPHAKEAGGAGFMAAKSAC